MKKRIEYIDALRGFTMIFVVLAHVIQYTYNGIDGFSWGKYCMVFRMPLFFFISGFILYKSERIWDFKTIRSFLISKFKVQILTTLAFLSLYIYIYDLTIMDVLDDKFKAGYWFTIVLFCYFAIYSILMCALKLFGGFALLIIFLISLPMVFLNTNIVNRMICDSGIPNIICIQWWQYFVFFVFGTIVKKYFDKVQQLLDDVRFMSVLISLFFLSSLLWFGKPMNIIGIKLTFLFWGISGLLIVFAFFRKHEISVSQQTKIGRSLQYIGRRTLDIYLLHYFFIPRNMSSLADLLNKNNCPTVELFVSLVFAAMTIVMCLIASSIIRVSPLLAHWLLGVKKVK